MITFKILMSGNNVFLRNNSDIKRYGFYITIFSSGENKDSAIDFAKSEVIRRLKKKTEVEKSKLDLINLVPEEIFSVEPQDVSIETEQGFVWYVDDEITG